MNLKEKEKITLSLIETFNKAGNLALDLRFKGIKKEIKSDNTPVSNGDLEVNKLLSSKIKEITPNIPIVSEENSEHKNDKDLEDFWLIDPIDGTRSFVIGNPTWSNLISLNYKGYPILGLANFPVLKKYYLNYSDKIAYVYDNGKRKKISVNKKATFSGAKLSAAFHGALSLNQQKKIPKILKLMHRVVLLFAMII